jgi:hypothetical protein
MHYGYYMQLNLPDTLKHDLRDGTRELIISLYVHFSIGHNKRYSRKEVKKFVDRALELFDEIILCIAQNAQGKGGGVFERFRDEAYGWMSEAIIPVIMSGHFENAAGVWKPKFEISVN